jgi:hypothetical protein
MDQNDSYYPDEVFEEKGFTKESDVYQIGKTFMRLMTLRDIDTTDMGLKEIKESLPEVYHEMDELLNIILCLVEEKEERVSLEKLNNLYESNFKRKDILPLKEDSKKKEEKTRSKKPRLESFSYFSNAVDFKEKEMKTSDFLQGNVTNNNIEEEKILKKDEINIIEEEKEENEGIFKKEENEPSDDEEEEEEEFKISDMMKPSIKNNEKDLNITDMKKNRKIEKKKEKRNLAMPIIKKKMKKNDLNEKDDRVINYNF